MKSSKIFFFITILFLFASCEKGFEELNKNPYFPTQTDIGPLFNNVNQSLLLGWDEQFYLHNDTYYAITQQAALTSRFSEINISGSENVWKNYYAALSHIRELETRFDAMEVEPEALNNVRAMVKILLAYKTFRITDQFGDMPFFDAGKGFESLENLRPKFDDQESIYKFLLDELKWASENINSLPNPVTASGADYVSLKEFDVLFDGDLIRWIKFANSLRLRHALRMAGKDSNFANPILKDIIENNLPIIEEGEDVVLVPRKLQLLKQSTHWSFREHKKLRLGTTMWHELSDSDDLDGSGIFDPRAHLFFDTNNDKEWRPFPQNPEINTIPAGGIPYQGQRDFNFESRGMDNIYSPLNYYLIRDEFDIPEILLTAAEMNFVKAEAYLLGLGVAENQPQAEAEYTQGVVTSLTMWQNIAQNSIIWTNAPEPLEIGQIFAVTNHPKISIFSNENKLKLIHTQRWIDAFRQPWEAYALVRRTNNTPREGAANQHFRLPYPPSEAENNPDNWLNQVSKMGADTPDTKVWWNQ